MLTNTHYTHENFFSTELFRSVQLSGIFGDSKTFVDTIPKLPLEEILALYENEKQQPDFQLEVFILTYFQLPESIESCPRQQELLQRLDMIEHCKQVLEHNFRQPLPEEEPGSFINLKFPYVIPGGRFREMYYWDTYFTAEGLAPLGRIQEVEQLIQNFADLIDRFGYIPNGNRTYYLGRSQPPFFALILNLLHRCEGITAVLPYVSQLEKEYQFWMDGAEQIRNSNTPTAHRRAVCVEPGVILNRYYSDTTSPRPESYKEDTEAFEKFKQLMQEQGNSLRDDAQAHFYREICAAVESGWDFSSRWWHTVDGVSRIRATELIPIDLNALLYYMEKQLSRYYAWLEDEARSASYAQAAEQRMQAINTYCWNQADGLYEDYCWIESRNQHQIIHSGKKSLATVVPLFVKLCDEAQAETIAHVLESEFFVFCEQHGGGLSTTLEASTEQWDKHNAWSPLQSMAFYGLKNYNLDKTHHVANKIRTAWLTLTDSHYQRERKMVEKYHVSSADAGVGGEYAVQEGFGWTNAGVICFDSDTTFDPYPS